jgi:hypothetical protein
MLEPRPVGVRLVEWRMEQDPDESVAAEADDDALE